MRHLGKSLLCLGAIAIATTPAFAQRPGGAGGGGGRMGMGMGGGAMLLRNPGVQQELKLDEGQVEKVNALIEEQGEKMREQFQSAAPAERRQLMEKMNRENMTALGSIFKPEQMKRFEQIALQQQGIRAFASPDVQGRMKLTDDQKTKVRAMADEADAAMQSGEGSMQERMQKAMALQKAQMEKAHAMFNDEQKAAWTELTGTPFEVRFGGGGAGAGGGRPNPNR